MMTFDIGTPSSEHSFLRCAIKLNCCSMTVWMGMNFTEVEASDPKLVKKPTGAADL